MFALVSKEPSRRTETAFAEVTRSRQLAWVRAVMAHGNLNQLGLAQKSGVNQTTLSKFLNDPNNIRRLQTASVEKIRAITPIPPYETETPTTPRGFGEAEAVPYQPHSVDGVITAAIARITEGSNALVPWRVNTRALEAAGYILGDVMIVDLNASPQNGDIVCAQIYHAHGAETVFRIFEHPFLVAASLDGTLRRPVLIDGQNVQIRGVVIASFRPRQFQFVS